MENKTILNINSDKVLTATVRVLKFMANMHFISKGQRVNTPSSNCSEISPGRKKTKSNISFYYNIQTLE